MGLGGGRGRWRRMSGYPVTARSDSWRRWVEVDGGRTAGMKSRPMQWADAADSLTERSCGSAAPSVIASVVRSARR